MINYSITARAVNPNLFEINQAKTRINQAKAEGKQPDAKDVALVETVVTNYFATAQYTEVMGIEKFARHIADHGTTYSRADIMAILYMAVDCMREQLLEGKKIRLGELGDFSLSLSSKGAEISTLVLPSLMALRTAAWADRVATRLNSASARRLRNSLPGSQQTVTRWMFCELNFSAVSAPLLLSDREKSPSSPRRIFLPSSSCSRMQSTAM